MAISFDIILPTYNNLDELKVCLNSFIQQTYHNFSVIVCVDGSADGTFEYLESADYPFSLKVITYPDKQNYGRPSARNLALTTITAAYIIMLDSDLAASPNLVEQYANWFQHHPDTIAVGEVQYSNIETNLWAAYMTTRGKNKYPDKACIPFQYLNTQNLAIPAKFFIDTNGLDARITGYGGDDTEWAYRINLQFQTKTYFLKNAVAKGEMNKSLETALKQMEEFGATSLKYIINKHADFKEIFKSERFNHWILDLLPLTLFNYFARLFLKCPIKKIQVLAVHYLAFEGIRNGLMDK